MGSISNASVPVLDFTNADLEPNTALWRTTAKEACKALEEYGCFVAVYDKIESDLENAMFGSAEDLFGLPTETKMKNVNDKPYHGYVGQISVIPLHEGMGVDYVTEKEKVEEFVDVMWPQGNDAFCQTVSAFANAVSELDRLVVRMIFETYGVEKYYEEHIGLKSYLLKFLKYNAPPEAGPAPAFPQHTDKTFLSILHQNDVNGLEVKTPDGQWIGLVLPPDSYVVMCGDTSKGWSNGRIRSCEHKVTMNGNKTRYTIGLFSFVAGTITVPEELVDGDHPLKYKPFNNIALINFYATPEGRKAESTLESYCGIQRETK